MSEFNVWIFEFNFGKIAWIRANGFDFVALKLLIPLGYDVYRPWSRVFNRQLCQEETYYDNIFLKALIAPFNLSSVNYRKIFKLLNVLYISNSIILFLYNAKIHFQSPLMQISYFQQIYSILRIFLCLYFHSTRFYKNESYKEKNMACFSFLGSLIKVWLAPTLHLWKVWRHEILMLVVVRVMWWKNEDVSKLYDASDDIILCLL